jgi:hypothetical protein
VDPLYVLMKEVIIPERAYLRITAASDKAQRKMLNGAAQQIRRMLTGEGSARDVLDTIGLSMAASVRSTIVDGVGPENSPLTLRLKRGTRPLVDTGRLHQSISHEVIL